MIINSNNLIAIDRFMDRSIVFSFVNNAVNLVIKIFLHFQTKEQSQQNKDTPLAHYWTYIAQKDASTCGLGLIPVLGTGLILYKDKKETEQANADCQRIKDALNTNDFETVQESEIIEELHKLKADRQARIWKSDAFIDLIRHEVEISDPQNPQSLINQIPVEQLYKMRQLRSIKLTADEEANPLSQLSFGNKVIVYALAAHAVMNAK